MGRLLVSSVLIAALVGCEDAPEETRMGAEAVDEVDATVALPSILVSNVGAACEDDASCGDVTAECLTRSSTATTYPGGYCTASCTSDQECGPEGVCPVAEAERADPRYDTMASWPRKCFRRCSPDMATTGCRPDYRCRSLADAYWRPAAPAPLHVPVCIPMPPSAESADAGELGLDAGDRIKR